MPSPNDGRKTSRLVGGKFGLESYSIETPKRVLSELLPRGKRHLFANARSALKLMIDALTPEQIWLPSYFCPSMLQGLGEFKDQIHFYPVNQKLEYVPGSGLDNFGKNDLVVAIEYFGFPVSKTLLEICDESGSTVLVDACQALLSTHESRANRYCLFSVRKFFGLPDGAILIEQPEGTLELEKRIPLPDGWLRNTIEGLQLRRDFDRGRNSSRNWFEILQESERLMPCGNYDISKISKDAIEGKLDVSESINKRRKNFEYLLSQLRTWSLFKNLPNTAVPLGFPVRVGSRDTVQKNLFLNNIYPPIHWTLDQYRSTQFEESLQLSRQIMTLPCDQRYDEMDMNFVAQAFRSCVGE